MNFTPSGSQRRAHSGYPGYRFSFHTLCLILSSVLVDASLALAAKAPTIRLFPTTVVENVKETGKVARDMETSLQGVIADLEQQMTLYQESKCEGSEGDPGCSQIAQQLGEKYLEMLSLMDDQLPRIEKSVEATLNSLEGRLRQELGQKQTARDLQEMLIAETSRGTPAVQTDKRSSGRLSERFRQYYKLVAQADSRTEGSVALVAADIYLDSSEVLDLVRLTRDEIARSQVMIEIRNEFGVVTPEMTEVVTGVKNVLFGEDDAAATLEAEPPADTFPEAYRSPLEF